MTGMPRALAFCTALAMAARSSGSTRMMSTPWLTKFSIFETCFSRLPSEPCQIVFTPWSLPASSPAWRMRTKTEFCRSMATIPSTGVLSAAAGAGAASIDSVAASSADSESLRHPYMAFLSAAGWREVTDGDRRVTEWYFSIDRKVNQKNSKPLRDYPGKAQIYTEHTHLSAVLMDHPENGRSFRMTTR